MNDTNNSPSLAGAITIDQERCKGCGLCIEACPKDLISFVGRTVNSHGYPYVTTAGTDACTGCASCGIICPDGCITVYRKKRTTA